MLFPAYLKGLGDVRAILTKRHDSGGSDFSEVGEMRENRRFVRVRPTGLVSRTGKIIINPKVPTIDCGIVDLSAGGACLEVDGAAALPKRFILLHGGTKKNCCLVWQKGRRLGVSF